MAHRKRILMVIGFFNPGILAGFSRYAREANWILNAFFVLHGVVPKGWRAHGMLTTNVFRPDLRQFVTATATRIPTVLHGSNDLGLPVPNVECDECAVGRLAAKHLLALGHKHFAWFQYSRDHHARQRREGFREELAAAGFECIILEKIAAHGVGSGEWFGRHLAALPKPLGLFAEDDILAARVIDSTLAAGLRVPEDLSVVGAGNISLACDQSEVPITSVAIPFEEEAYRAAAMLDRLLSGKALEERTVIFAPTGLIARQSTNSVAAQRPIVQRSLALIAAHFQDAKLDVKAIARSTGVSTRSLYNEFKRDLRSTPMAEMERIRIRKAKELLLAGTEKIETVSTECGFANLRTFLRAFRRSEHRSPARWRDEVKKAASAGIFGAPGGNATPVEVTRRAFYRRPAGSRSGA